MLGLMLCHYCPCIMTCLWPRDTRDKGSSCCCCNQLLYPTLLCPMPSQTFKIEPFKHPIAMDPNYAGLSTAMAPLKHPSPTCPFGAGLLCSAELYAGSACSPNLGRVSWRKQLTVRWAKLPFTCFCRQDLEDPGVCYQGDPQPECQWAQL